MEILNPVVTYISIYPIWMYQARASRGALRVPCGAPCCCRPYSFCHVRIFNLNMASKQQPAAPHPHRDSGRSGIKAHQGARFARGEMDANARAAMSEEIVAAFREGGMAHAAIQAAIAASLAQAQEATAAAAAPSSARRRRKTAMEPMAAAFMSENGVRFVSALRLQV